MKHETDFKNLAKIVRRFNKIIDIFLMVINNRISAKSNPKQILSWIKNQVCWGHGAFLDCAGSQKSYDHLNALTHNQVLQ